MAITKKQLEEQNAALRKENEKLHSQIDARVEESGAYQALKAQIDNEISKKETLKRQAENWKNQYFELQAKYSDLSRQLKAKQAELDTIKSNLEAAQAELKHESAKSQKNPFGAGRKRSYTTQLEQIMHLRESGSSIRAIAKELNIPFATVARYIRENELK
jgi:DNA-binding NarL/FixJ family response regulator